MDSSHLIDHNAKVSNLIAGFRSWNTEILKEIFPPYITTNIKSIPIPLFNIDDKLTWKYSNDAEFSIKTATWVNNDSVEPQNKARFVIIFGLKTTTWVNNDSIEPQSKARFLIIFGLESYS